jgi:hypothetical protein
LERASMSRVRSSAIGEHLRGYGPNSHHRFSS